MNIILDTSDIKSIRKWSKLLSPKVNSITTNPKLLKEAGINSKEKFIEFINQVSDFIGHPTIFFQCFSEDDIHNLISIRNDVSGIETVEIVAKIAMHPKYFNLVEKAKNHKFITAATTCYDLVQIHQACEFEMDYSMVYFAKNENESLLYDAVKMKRDYNYNTTLVAASFRTKKDIINAIKSGIDSATIRPETLEKGFENNNVVSDVLDFFDMPDPLDVLK